MVLNKDELLKLLWDEGEAIGTVDLGYYLNLLVGDSNIKTALNQ